MDLQDFFSRVPDPRRAQGRRYPLNAMLWMIFIAIASGHHGYRKMGNFCKSNAAFFTTYFGLRHGVPSHVSIRALLMALDKNVLAHAFAQLAQDYLQPGDWVAGDGQLLRSTVCDAQQASQHFCSVVSLYCQRTGLTLAVQDYTSRKTSEIEVLRDLLDTLRTKGVILTLDALHCQKKQSSAW